MKRIIAFAFAALLAGQTEAQLAVDCGARDCEICESRFEDWLQMANDRKETAGDVTANFPTTNMTLRAKLDYDENAGAAYDAVETGTVPGAPYQIELDSKPLRNFGVTIEVGGSPRTLRRIGTEGSGEVGIDFNTGLVQFHSSDTGGTYTVERRGLGSVITATDWNTISKEVIATQTYARTAVIGPASATDNAVARFNLTTGKLVQDSLLIVDDSGNTSTTGTMGASNLSGTNSGNVTLTAGLGNIISISTQLLGLQTQTANTVLAGPVSGGAATPTFRALGNADLSGTTAAYTDAGNIFTTSQIISNGGSGSAPLISWYQGGTAGTAYPFLQGHVSDTTSPLNRQQHRFMAAASSAATATFDHFWPAVNGTVVTTAASPLSVNATTGEVSIGTVPIAKGGTNSTATPTAGGIAYGTGTAYAVTSAGTSGQIAISGGSGAPTWITRDRVLYSTGTSAGAGTNRTLTIAANTLSANGDTIKVQAVIKSIGATSDEWDLDFAGTNIILNSLGSGEVNTVEAIITRDANNRVSVIVRGNAADGSALAVVPPFASIGGLDLAATAYNVELKIFSNSDMEVLVFRVEFQKAP